MELLASLYALSPLLGSLFVIAVLVAVGQAALVGIDAGGNEVATSDAGALTLMDNADDNYATQKAAFLASRETPLAAVPYFLDKPIANAGAPTNGTSHVKTLTIGSTPDTTLKFLFTFEGQQTVEVVWSATNATLLARIQAALDALPNLRAGDITASAGSLTNGVGTILFTAGGYLAKLAIGDVTVTKTAGTGSVSMAQATTAGVTATGRGAAKGSLLQDTTNGGVYTNLGTPYSPIWSRLVTAPFLSSEQTGTGSEQSIAHGLPATPSKVVVIPTDLTPGTDGDYTSALGTHTSTNCLVTVTSGKKYVVMAWL